MSEAVWIMLLNTIQTSWVNPADIIFKAIPKGKSYILLDHCHCIFLLLSTCCSASGGIIVWSEHFLLRWSLKYQKTLEKFCDKNLYNTDFLFVYWLPQIMTTFYEYLLASAVFCLAGALFVTFEVLKRWFITPDTEVCRKCRNLYYI